MAQDNGGTEFVGSHEKANNGRGQNGDPNPSSVTDLKSIPQMNRDFGLAADPSSDAGDWQTRKVSSEQITAHPGMKSPDSKIDFPKANSRANATKRAMGGNYQR